MDHLGETTRDTERRDSEFLRLLGRHECKIAACVHAMIPSWHDAEDIIQETRVQLWREFDKFESGTDFSAWACTVARYVVRSHISKNHRKPLLLNANLSEVLIAAVLDTPHPTDRRLAVLAKCASRLTDDTLRLLQRCYIDNQKIKDVAVEMGRSLAGTYQAISRARRELFDCMDQHLRGERDS